MHNTTKPPKYSSDRKLIPILVIIYSIIFAFIALAFGRIISFISFSLVVVTVLSKYIEPIREKFQFLKIKDIRIAIYSILILIGIAGIIPKQGSKNDALTNNSRQNDADYSYISNYINKNLNTPLISNIPHLKYWENMFEAEEFSSNINIQAGDCIIDSINGNYKKVIYTPTFITANLTSEEYLKVIPQHGMLRRYKLIFYLKDTLVDKMYAIIDCEVGGNIKTYLITNTGFDLTAFVNNSKIAAKRREVIEYKKTMKIEEQNSQKMAEISKQKEEFEKNCLSVKDGRCYDLVEYVKKRMNDPESFEHIQTKCFIHEDGYAIITMRFRGANSFGAKVINSIKAKVSFNCEVLSISTQ